MSKFFFIVQNAVQPKNSFGYLELGGFSRHSNCSSFILCVKLIHASSITGRAEIASTYLRNTPTYESAIPVDFDMFISDCSSQSGSPVINLLLPRAGEYSKDIREYSIM